MILQNIFQPIVMVLEHALAMSQTSSHIQATNMTSRGKMGQNILWRSILIFFLGIYSLGLVGWQRLLKFRYSEKATKIWNNNDPLFNGRLFQISVYFYTILYQLNLLQISLTNYRNNRNVIIFVNFFHTKI